MQNVSFDEPEALNTEIDDIQDWGVHSLYKNANSSAYEKPNASRIVVALQTCGSLVDSEDLKDSENDDLEGHTQSSKGTSTVQRTTRNIL